MPDTDKYNIILKYLKRCIRNELTNRRGVYKLRCVLFFCEFLAYCTNCDLSAKKKTHSGMQAKSKNFTLVMSRIILFDLLRYGSFLHHHVLREFI